MKKTIIGIVVIICIVMGSIKVLNNSKEPIVLSQNEEITDVSADLKENTFLVKSIFEGLKGYEGIENVQANYQESLTIQTSIDSSDTNSENTAKDIHKRVKEILKSKELESISEIDSYEVYVRDKDGKIID